MPSVCRFAIGLNRLFALSWLGLKPGDDVSGGVPPAESAVVELKAVDRVRGGTYLARSVLAPPRGAKSTMGWAQ